MINDIKETDLRIAGLSTGVPLTCVSAGQCGEQLECETV
jgi:hypothetical protein